MKQLKIATKTNADNIAEKLREQGFFVVRMFDGRHYYLIISRL
ncbi:hypothetical protein [Desulfobulbus rhabdoformis]|nr:hypothetical protein [Desulfobulbus rhabdoformis]